MDNTYIKTLKRNSFTSTFAAVPCTLPGRWWRLVTGRKPEIFMVTAVLVTTFSSEFRYSNIINKRDRWQVVVGPVITTDFYDFEAATTCTIVIVRVFFKRSCDGAVRLQCTKLRFISIPHVDYKSILINFIYNDL